MYSSVTNTLWAMAVIERDEMCGICGRQDGLQAHHIIFKRYENTRFLVDNGLTLCFECHRWVHDNPMESKKHFPLYETLKKIADLKFETDSKNLIL